MPAVHACMHGARHCIEACNNCPRPPAPPVLPAAFSVRPVLLATHCIMPRLHIVHRTQGPAPSTQGQCRACCDDAAMTHRQGMSMHLHACRSLLWGAFMGSFVSWCLAWFQVGVRARMCACVRMCAPGCMHVFVRAVCMCSCTCVCVLRACVRVFVCACVCLAWFHACVRACVVRVRGGARARPRVFEQPCASRLGSSSPVVAHARRTGNALPRSPLNAALIVPLLHVADRKSVV